MGSGASKALSSNIKWNRLKLANVFDGVDEIGKLDEIEFYSLLQEVKEMDFIRAYSKLCGKFYLFTIWDLILDCESTYANYKELKTLCLSLIVHEGSFPTLAELIKHSECDFYDEVQAMALLNQIKHRCSYLIYTTVYIPSINSPRYNEIRSSFSTASAANLISVDSFDYLSIIGRGGFGLVVLARMKISGSTYAMKIQPKVLLLRRNKKDCGRITSELAASVVLNHPYLSGIACGFQTDTLTMLVSPVCTCGDLRRSLKLCPNKQMSLDRVVFYAAEIVSALMYLHCHDIMYRDLKPSNVLLNGDGHIKLADFGSVTGKYMYDLHNYEY